MKSSVHRLPFALSIVFASMLSGVAYAQDDDEDFMGDMSLQDLFAIDTDIASNTSRTVTEQPSIISVVTREQILHSGARDLVDVLRMVPGFGIAHDTIGINSWGFRGIWGHEGKIMLLVDGAPFNDAAYGNVQLGRRFPVELISKIEIIRGPGAAKFGNYAELAVVRITTIGKEMNGGYVDTNVRVMDDAFGSGEFTAAYGKEMDNGWGYSVSMHVKDSIRTRLPLDNADKTIRVYQENSPQHGIYFDAKASYKDIQFSTLVERYTFQTQENFLQEPDPNTLIEMGYSRFHLAADYSGEIAENWKLNANVLYQETTSHDMVVKESRNNEFKLGTAYRIPTERIIYSVDAMYTLSEDSSLNFGVEYFEVDAKSVNIGEFFVDPAHGIPGDSTEFADFWFDVFTTNTYNFNQQSAFVQYENYNDIVNFTLGVRFADHSRSSEKVTVPRIGFSKEWGDFGAKAMYSEAFRTGDAEHLNLFKDSATSQLEPESLDSQEIEFHYLHETGMYTINFFEMNIANPIIFNTDAVTENQKEIVSAGFEASWRGKGKGYEQEFTISYYRGGDNSAPVQLAQDEESYLGFPQVKVTWQLDYQWTENTNFSPSIMYE
ncbi:MAG: TonB-dependent receptor plug domain-containing protein, partial [Algicola sp.]|nr:TonB-dependent receptor plug domain-containing protein [Algicola sp.]